MILPDLESVVSLHDFVFDDEVSINELAAELRSAESYLQSFKWCKSIEQRYVGAAYPGIVFVLLFKVLPTRANIDPWIWTVTGDLPPLYLTCSVGTKPWEILDGYIGAYEAWIAAVDQRKSVSDLAPSGVPATPENARSLESRLRFLDQKILPELKGTQDADVAM